MLMTVTASIAVTAPEFTRKLVTVTRIAGKHGGLLADRYPGRAQCVS